MVLGLLKRRSTTETDAIQREKAACELLDELHAEAQAYRGACDVGMSIEAEWEQNGNRFLGNHWTSYETNAGLQQGYRVFHASREAESGGPLGLKRSTLNRTQNSVVSNVAGMLNSIAARLEPAETSGDATHKLSAQGGQTLWDIIFAPVRAVERDRDQRGRQAALVRDMTAFTAASQEADEAIASHQARLAQLGLDGFDEEQLQGEHGPTGFLKPRQVRRVRDLIAQGMLEEDDLITMDDTWTAHVGQEVFDRLWNKANAEQAHTVNQLLCAIFGNQPILFQWHTSGQFKHSFTLENVHVLNVWLDHAHDDISRSDYVIFEYVVSLDQALAMFDGDEAVQTALKAAADKGELRNDHYRRGGIYENHDYKRKMVVLRTGWVRHQQVPMTEEEALEEGLVTREPLLDEATGAQAVDRLTGQPKWRYFLTETDEGEAEGASGGEVEPQEDTDHGTPWPNTYGLRQIVVLPQAKKRIQDIRCPYWDIPMAWNINLLRPDGSPYGQGEPMRLEAVSQQINRILTILDNHIRWYQFPQRYWPQDVLDKVQVKGFKLHSRPGAEVGIPRTDWERMMDRGGFDRMTQNIPAVPALYIQLLELYLQEHDNLSGHVDVRQGRAPYSGASGRLVQQLAEEAGGPLALRARWSEWAIERTAKLAIDAIGKWLPEARLQKMLGRYDLPTIREWRRRFLMAEWNVVVELPNGRGSNRSQQRMEAMEMRGAGLLSRQTTMERMGVEDPDAEERRIMEEMTGQAQASPAVQAATVDYMDPAQQTAPAQAGAAAAPTPAGA